MKTIYDKESATYGVSFCTVSSEHVVLLKTLPNLQPNTFSSKNNLMITAGKVCAHSLPHVRSQMKCPESQQRMKKRLQRALRIPTSCRRLVRWQIMMTCTMMHLPSCSLQILEKNHIELANEYSNTDLSFSRNVVSVLVQVWEFWILSCGRRGNLLIGRMLNWTRIRWSNMLLPTSKSCNR